LLLLLVLVVAGPRVPLPLLRRLGTQPMLPVLRVTVLPVVPALLPLRRRRQSTRSA
jgi:hypothetical protein